MVIYSIYLILYSLQSCDDYELTVLLSGQAHAAKCSKPGYDLILPRLYLLMTRYGLTYLQTEVQPPNGKLPCYLSCPISSH